MTESSFTSFGLVSFFQLLSFCFTKDTSVLIFSSSGVLSLLLIGDGFWKIDSWNVE